MSAIVFGTPEAAAIVQRDKAIDELEDLARSMEVWGYWVHDDKLTPRLRAAVKALCDCGKWERVIDDIDGDVTSSYRPVGWATYSTPDDDVFDVMTSEGAAQP